MVSSVVVLELNELSPPLLDRFMAAGDLPNFVRLRSRSRCFITDADEPQERLNPWIQWVTAHTGVGFEQHRVFKLGEGANLALPTIADAVGEAGGSVWLCGPMNVVPLRPVRGRWLPDPWNPDGHASPSAFGPFVAFVRANVQEHSNPRHRLSRGAYLRFLTFMARHGLSPSTVSAAVAQLVGERTGRRHRWHRAALLDRFQWDLFRHELKRNGPTFATYFSNTTAHYQHLYWRYMDPEPFDLKPTESERSDYGGAIRLGYREMDRIVGEALDLVHDDAALVFCSAISQQPYLQKDDQGGSRFYRPHDMSAFAALLHLHGVRAIAPVMSEQFHLYFDSDADAVLAEKSLLELTVDGQPAFDVRRNGDDVLTGCAITHEVPSGAVIVGPGGLQVPFHEHLYRSETAKSGYHHPDGLLWVSVSGVSTSASSASVTDEHVSLRAVAPTVLDLLDIAPPPSMSTPPLDLTSEGIR